ncbi:MAG: MarR family winged helix-turn-helix transcriptional regulator [Chloroflexota bacterium]
MNITNSSIDPAVAATGQHPSRAVVAWLRLVRVFQKVDHISAETMRCRKLSMAQFDVLSQVGSNEGLTQQELATSLLVTKGNVCQLLDRMEASGLLERRQEGRSNRLYLTTCGRTLFESAVPAQNDTIDRLFSSLSEEEQRDLTHILRKLDQSLTMPGDSCRE